MSGTTPWPPIHKKMLFSSSVIKKGLKQLTFLFVNFDNNAIGFFRVPKCVWAIIICCVPAFGVEADAFIAELEKRSVKGLRTSVRFQNFVSFETKRCHANRAFTTCKVNLSGNCHINHRTWHFKPLVAIVTLTTGRDTTNLQWLLSL